MNKNLKSIQLYLSKQFSSNELSSVLDNISTLLESGMGIYKAINTLEDSSRSFYVKTQLQKVVSDLDSGLSLSKSLVENGLIKPRYKYLISVGEQSGNLPKMFSLLTEESRKDSEFRSKILSATYYPAFIFLVLILVGLFSSWFLLPRLSSVFDSLDVQLPKITIFTLWLGDVMQLYGLYIVIGVITFIALLYFFLFSFSKTKFIGHNFLISFPVIGGLLRNIETAKFAVSFGNLLNSGVPLSSALESLSDISFLVPYKNFYKHLSTKIQQGFSIEKAFKSFKKTNKLYDATVVQLISSGEQSGNLSDVLIKLSKAYTTKIDISSKNIGTLFEPLILVFVWLGVLFVALSIILPIYSLVGNFGGSQVDTTENPVVITTSPAPEISPTISPTPTENIPKKQIKILNTGIGFLNVRSEPSTSGDIVDSITPGEVFEYTEVSNGWYSIILDESSDLTGWVIGDYVEVYEE